MSEFECSLCGKAISWWAFRASTSSVYKKAMCNLCWYKARVDSLQNRAGEAKKAEASSILEANKNV